ncbi:MAG: ergothioneine biosynthesis protein EgtB [Gammaproteobacteria bacterium]|nr:ergothioneine biosynthesis protein EgtB [Gammaproteobacteria bacterium]
MTDNNDLRAEIHQELELVRSETLRLTNALDDETVCGQFSALMSPLLWDLGHIAHFEALWLLRNLGARTDRRQDFDRYFDPIETPRAVRGSLSLPPRDQILDYLRQIRSDVIGHLDRQQFDTKLTKNGFVYHMIAQHEAQHQETMLQSLDLHTECEPFVLARAERSSSQRVVNPFERVEIADCSPVIGTHDRTYAYDNERPAHVTNVNAFAIDKFPVTNARFLSFINDDGYVREELWSEPGREWLKTHRLRAPQGWIETDAQGWQISRFGHIHDFEPDEIAQHISFFEADAFARWSGARLPSEAEWETAAGWNVAQQKASTFPWGEEPATPNRANLDHHLWGPSKIGAYPNGQSAFGVEHMLGDTYEWTSDTFRPYPGFNAYPYREYSDTFFGSEYHVLRGASWATTSQCARNSFRNWDYPIRRQIFAGVRLAWDAD